MEFKKKREKSVHLDITPVVDTVFNLLIFFALSMNFTAGTALNVQLPSVSTQQPVQAAGISIEVSRQGDISIDRQPVALRALRGILIKKKSSIAKPHVIIKADKSVPHGTVVRLMDMCKGAGYKKISIAAELTAIEN